MNSHHALPPGEMARRAHSIGSAIAEGFLVWYAVLGGIAAWAIHLIFFVSFVRFTCNAHGYVWALHALTVVTLAMTGVALWLCRRMLHQAAAANAKDPRQNAGHEDGDAGHLAFLARLGVLVGTINVALIALEELYVVVLNSRRCG